MAATSSSGYDGEGQHHAHGRTAKHNTTPGGDAGVAGMLSNRRWRRRPAADTEKKSRSPSKAKPEQIEPRGQDRLGEAQR
jgi:hypothetical protein